MMRMLPANKHKALAALKRMNGLAKKIECMIEADAPCPQLLEMSLAMKGHVEHAQALILESHLHTCASKQLASSNKEKFIKELLRIIGLSRR